MEWWLLFRFLVLAEFFGVYLFISFFQFFRVYACVICILNLIYVFSVVFVVLFYKILNKNKRKLCEMECAHCKRMLLMLLNGLFSANYPTVLHQEIFYCVVLNLKFYLIPSVLLPK